jgi:hypothetical protein
MSGRFIEDSGWGKLHFAVWKSFAGQIHTPVRLQRPSAQQANQSAQGAFD